MKYNELKERIADIARTAANYKDQAITARIMLAKAEDEIERLTGALQQTVIERDIARNSAKHPSATNLILTNHKLKGEISHLQRLVNTRRR